MNRAARCIICSTVSASAGMECECSHSTVCPVMLPQSRSLSSGVSVICMPRAPLMISAVFTHLRRSLHSSTSNVVPFSLSRSWRACSSPRGVSVPGMCPCSMWAVFSSVWPCRTRYMVVLSISVLSFCCVAMCQNIYLNDLPPILTIYIFPLSRCSGTIVSSCCAIAVPASVPSVR